MERAHGAADWIAYLEGAGALDPADQELRERLQEWDTTFTDLERVGILTHRERMDLGERVSGWLVGLLA